jgi:anti-sigma B factor antagonist
LRGFEELNDWIGEQGGGARAPLRSRHIRAGSAVSGQRDQPRDEQAEQHVGFEVQHIVSADRHRLSLRGELDLGPAAELEGILERICVDATSAVVLDLSRLTFMGSTGLRVILLAQELCERHDCEFRVVPGPRNVQRIFELAGLLEVLPLESDADPQRP